MIISQRIARLGLATMLVGLMAFQSTLLWAGHFGFRGGAVGGISVNGEGVVREAEVASRNQLRQALEKEVKQASDEMNPPVEMRLISLRSLNDAIADARAKNLGQLPDDIKFLGGLTRIQFVLVYPEQHDIVIGGPAEGWRVDQNANVVGVTTGRPVIQLDDLLVALRSVHRAREEGISCSIDPTQHGLQQYKKITSASSGWLPSGDNVKALQDAMGPYNIKLTGVPGNSHFARVMVAADYHMKRLALKLDPSPVKGLSSYMDKIKNASRLTGALPRWWLACNYEPLLKSEDGLAWEIRGQGVKCLSEDDFVNADGTISQSGKTNPLIAQWADEMTKQYDKLSAKNVVFGELRNIMDLCVVAALIEKEGMAEKVGLHIPLLTDPDSDLTILNWAVPKTVATHCSLVQSGGKVTMATSGGVQVDSWTVASHSQVAPQLAALRAKVGENSRRAWWFQ